MGKFEVNKDQRVIVHDVGEHDIISLIDMLVAIEGVLVLLAVLLQGLVNRGSEGFERQLKHPVAELLEGLQVLVVYLLGFVVECIEEVGRDSHQDTQKQYHCDSIYMLSLFNVQTYHQFTSH